MDPTSVFGSDPALGTDPAANSQAGGFFGYLTTAAGTATNLINAIKGKPATGTQPVATPAQQQANQQKLLLYGGLALAGLLGVGLFLMAMFRTRSN